MSILILEDRSFALSNAHFTYVMQVNDQGLLVHKYYGAPLSEPWEVLDYHPSRERALSSEYEGVKNLHLNELPLEYPTYGRSDYRTPAFHAKNADGNTIFSFVYSAYELLDDKPSIDGLPSAAGQGSQTLVIHLEDNLWNLGVELRYTVYDDYGVLAKSVRYQNRGDQPIELQHVGSSSLHLPASTYEVLHLHGTWSREMNEERVLMPQGKLVIDSTRGASSAVHSPFLALMEKGTNEDFGEVYASTLVYSGNFALVAEKGEYHDVRILTGINHFNFSWQLDPDQSFYTPEALHVYSNRGLSLMSKHWHSFVRDRISPTRFRDVERPSYLNTWEACYFDVNEEKVLALADRAVDLGLDMLVLDDGWFAGRNDDTTSLGDWVADDEKFPKGIPYLAKEVKKKGLKFGLWFEPEMVNPQSRLYKDHPDWILHVPGRTSSLGRNQLTLDLSRQEVTDYIYNQLSTILDSGHIDYVKWDMNRCMTEIGSRGSSPSRQGEVAHRYMLGLYALLDKITSRYPQVLFENCASGGNRLDMGMMCYFPQTWTSDMCDPVGRLQIIHGASYLYPNDILAAYVGPSPNHQNGRVTSIESRYLAGVFCAARGFSLNITELEQDEIKSVKIYADFTKQSAADMLGGSFYRLVRHKNYVIWQYITKDGAKVYVLYFNILSAANEPVRRVRLKDLDMQACYQLRQEEKSYRGDTLMHAGIELPTFSNKKEDGVRLLPLGDFSSMLFTFFKD